MLEGRTILVRCGSFPVRCGLCQHAGCDAGHGRPDHGGTLGGSVPGQHLGAQRCHVAR